MIRGMAHAPSSKNVPECPRKSIIRGIAPPVAVDVAERRASPHGSAVRIATRSRENEENPSPHPYRLAVHACVPFPSTQNAAPSTQDFTRRTQREGTDKEFHSDLFIPSIHESTNGRE
jgi:hypothetical protein